MIHKEQQSTILSSSTPLRSCSISESSHDVEHLRMRIDHIPLTQKNKKMLSKQLSMRETRQDIAWERRRRQMLDQEIKKNSTVTNVNECDDRLTDEDLSELKGSIELGFGFNEDGVNKSVGKRLCNTLPALDLYFAVNRQFATSPIMSPSNHRSSTSSLSSLSSTTSSLSGGSPSVGSPNCDDSWKLCSPGDSPQQMKTKLRHWAQAVACSVRQQAY